MTQIWRRIFAATLCALVSGAMLPCWIGTGRAAVLDRVVAVVDNTIILQSELDQMAIPSFREPVDLGTEEGRRKLDAHRRKVLDQLIEKQLIAHQGKEMKVSVTEADVNKAMDEVKKNNNLDDVTFTEALKQQGFSMEAYKKQLKQQILELKVVNQAVRSRVSVGDEEVRAYYAQNVRQASGDEAQVHLRQMLFAVPPGTTPAQADERRKAAQRVVDLLKEGGDFEKVAKAHGEDPVSKLGGDLGWLARGDLPQELRDVVGGMDKGDVRGPVRSDRGFHVLELVEKKDGGVKTFDEVKEQLRRQIYDQQVEKSVQSWLKELRRKAHVDVRLGAA